MKRTETEEILYLEDMYRLRDMRYTCVTVRINRWHHYIPRVKLTMVEDFHKTAEEIDKAISEYGKDPNFPDYPKHFEIVCRPEDMLKLAKTLIEICEPEK